MILPVVPWEPFAHTFPSTSLKDAIGRCTCNHSYVYKSCCSKLSLILRILFRKKSAKFSLITSLEAWSRRLFFLRLPVIFATNLCNYLVSPFNLLKFISVKLVPNCTLSLLKYFDLSIWNANHWWFSLYMSPDHLPSMHFCFLISYKYYCTMVDIVSWCELLPF